MFRHLQPSSFALTRLLIQIPASSALMFRILSSCCCCCCALRVLWSYVCTSRPHGAETPAIDYTEALYRRSFRRVARQRGRCSSSSMAHVPESRSHPDSERRTKTEYGSTIERMTSERKVVGFTAENSGDGRALLCWWTSAWLLDGHANSQTPAPGRQPVSKAVDIYMVSSPAPDELAVGTWLAGSPGVLALSAHLSSPWPSAFTSIVLAGSCVRRWSQTGHAGTAAMRASAGPT